MDSSKEHLFVFSNPKAGMDDIDRSTINQTIYDLSKDSAFFKNSVDKDVQTDKKIAAMRTQLGVKRRHNLVADVDQRVAALEASRDFSRVHVVVDMDMFFAAVEMRDNPSLAHVPMAVGGMGMICTANYAARKFGVRAAMPGFIAKKLCPSLVLVPPHFSKYEAVAHQTRDIFREFDPHFVAGSLDEAYLDITNYIASVSTTTLGGSSVCDPDAKCSRGSVSTEASSTPRATAGNVFVVEPNGHAYAFDENTSMEEKAGAVVQELRRRIHQATQLTASAGIASIPKLAKVCSDINKPNGQYVLPFNRDAIVKFVHHLPVRKFGGIGKVKEKLLAQVLNVATGGDLFARRYDIFHVFSEMSAQWLLQLSLGASASPSHDDDGDRPCQKSASRETTFRATSSLQELLERCQVLVKHVHSDLNELQLQGHCLTVKLKTTQFAVTSRAWTCKSALSQLSEMLDVACRLLVKEFNVAAKKHAKDASGPVTYRLLGIRMSMLKPAPSSSAGAWASPIPATSTADHDSAPQPPSVRQLSLPGVLHPALVPRQLSSTAPHAHHDATPSSEAREPCPVCGCHFDVWSLFLVNEHIDQCLSKTRSQPRRNHPSHVARAFNSNAIALSGSTSKLYSSPFFQPKPT
ncbi:hypothetical protein, variant 1 [Aphanomyces invadans]|uniref:DNA polymerase kappa n=1 Tax=Aphanomyces invadans TaxID=157072 RepID=A0A024THC9_9STRA|nr:hypothetical protein, variant 1 [Aphanomyces invadans]ETV93448.1 hypothetical protein, variant 1 [Aphanomyces invadans]|eukprot:XP_008877790.1 hypothetical protein, variant 1 [Aphanomyces invadans]